LSNIRLKDKIPGGAQSVQVVPEQLSDTGRSWILARTGARISYWTNL